MAILKPSEGGGELIEENEMVGVIITAIDPNNFMWEGEEVEKLRWVFSVTDQGPWQGKDVQGDTSQKFVPHPACKAYNWAAAVLGHEPPLDKDFDTDVLLGMPCRILIGHRKDKQGGVWMNVKEVMGPRPGAPTTVSAAPPASDTAPF